MNLPLKYLLPSLIFLAGFIMVSLQTYFHAKNEFRQTLHYASEQAKVVGNRLASRITYEMKSNEYSKEKMISLIAPYMADTLDHVAIYDEKIQQVFTSSIPSYENEKLKLFESNNAYNVIKDQFSDTIHKHESHHIVGYFPIDFPVREGKVLSRSTGVLHLVFDAHMNHLDAKEEIIDTAIMNISIVFIMVTFFSGLMYFLVFKRLDALHIATKKMAEGDFDVHVTTKYQDELSDVIGTFNTMAVDINAYIHNMEDQVNKAVKEQHEQSKIMIQQNRLASMGEMIGNIAHQWRQPLNALSLLIQKVELFSQRGKLTEEVLTENVQKASTIIENMSTTIDDFRDFFKPDKQMENFNLNTVVHDVITLQEATLNEANISLTINIHQPECEIYGFKNEFAQVIINLINNSKDALIENKIEQKQINISAEQKKDQVIFKLCDNAGGITDDIIDRIFEPYYTTKEEGKGTGIGLYMSKMIVEENMHGIMHVRNNETGAEFSMIFKNKKG